MTRLLPPLAALALALALAPASAARAGVPALPGLSGQTRPQAARAAMKPAMLAEVRAAAAKLHAKRRWTPADQDRFVITCATRSKPEYGLNPRACSCMLEVLMDAHASYDAYAKSVAGGKTPADEATKRGVGMCVVAFGT